MTEPRRLDEDEPHEPAVSARQINAVLGLLGPPPRRVLDLGCGAGRVLVPLARAGHDVTGIDRCPEACARCRARLAETGEGNARVVTADFRDARWPTGRDDAVLCLGNTFMEIADVDDAVALLRRVAAQLAPAGVFMIDDIPGDLWPEVTEGYWLAGMSADEDGPVQLAWAPTDDVFALRRGAAIDADRPAPGPDDRRLRLWTDGALRLAARCSGLSAPRRLPGGHVIVIGGSGEATKSPPG